MKLRTALVVLAVGVAACGSSEDATTTTSVQPTTTTSASLATPTTTLPEPTTSVATLSASDAMDVVDEYFDAYNSGDFSRFESLFTSDAVFADNFGPQERDFWAQLETWNLSQGTQLESIDCAPPEAVDGHLEVECTLLNLDSVVQAVSAPPVPIDLTLMITSEGIAERTMIFGQPDFLNALGPFYEWMATNHPDDAGSVGFGQWDSVESAAQNGLLMAQYAKAWAAFLESNNCSFDERC